MSVQPVTDTERDPQLDALYRDASREAPSAALDDAIRAAARRAVAAKPRLAGSPFSRSWRVPLSIAAVVMLSVSLVTVMREEAPEIVLSSHPDVAESRLAKDRQPVSSGPEIPAAAPRASVSEEQRASGVGLKPSRPASPSGIGLRRDAESSGPVVPLRKQAVPADRMEARAPAAPSRDQPGAAEAFPGARDNKAAARVDALRQAAKEEATRHAAPAADPRRRVVEGGSGGIAESTAPSTVAGVAAQLRSESDSARTPAPPAAKSAAAPSAMSAPVPRREPVPMAGSASPPVAAAEKQMAVAAGAVQSNVSLPPDKWLERIDELRKQGKLEEARAALQEFRKRYPNYKLPPALMEWLTP